ncbi:cyclase family protein [Sphingomonas sp. PAMC26645]|uniref:cyclase family protein n=1 Tax=Sphingomonas sp. PAMC26645 TaxID=2565555 RepID=UPI001B3530C0|nr:cyclase family protein [Sphingomonas sp. PAMC26645]
MNLLTPQKILEGAREVVAGRSFCLSLPLDLPGGNVGNLRRHPPRLFAAVQDEASVYNRVVGTSVVSDDAVLLYTQYSTQWDSFAHAGSLFDADDDGIAEPVYYNGWRAGETVVAPTETPGVEPWARFEGPHAHELGVDAFAVTGLQGRGVLVDLHARYGRDQHAVTGDELLRIMAEDRISVEPGDILCLYTGYDGVILEMGGRPTRDALHGTCSGLDGGDPQLQDWIRESGVAAIASDNRAVEIMPSPRAASGGISAPLHELCLFKLGIPLGEMWMLHELADWLRTNGRSRFLLTAPPLRLPGAVGSPVSPVATV